MRVATEMLTGLLPLTRASQDREAMLLQLGDVIFGQHACIHALVNSAALPMPGSWIEAQTPGALPLLQLDDDPTADKVMPFLLPLSRNDGFLRSALTMASPPTPKALWSSGAVIFIRQDLPTDALCARIRHNLMAQDEAGRNYYLRFWDSGVLLDLLQAIALEGRGFRGPFPAQATLFLPQGDDALLKVSLLGNESEADEASIILTAALRDSLAMTIKRRGIEAMLRDILASEDGNRDLLDRTCEKLLKAEWPLSALPPVLRVVARYNCTIDDMPPAARDILYHSTMSHTARGRVLEHEAEAIFRNAAEQGPGGKSDFWLLP